MAYKMVYNPLTGKWDKVWVDESTGSGGSGDTHGGATNEKPSAESGITEPPDLSQAGTSSSADYNELEYNILEGDAEVMPDPTVKAKTTVKLKGLGSQLTGNYYVESVKHSISSQGYSQTLTLSREGFGDSIKKG